MIVSRVRSLGTGALSSASHLVCTFVSELRPNGENAVGNWKGGFGSTGGPSASSPFRSSAQLLASTLCSSLSVILRLHKHSTALDLALATNCGLGGDNYSHFVRLPNRPELTTTVRQRMVCLCVIFICSFSSLFSAN